jgi:hypothetical protein
MNMEKVESVTGLRPLEAPQDETAAGAVVPEAGTVGFTQHQIDCVRKYCNDLCGPISTRWKGCSFPGDCVGYSPCKPEIERGLAIAAEALT